MAAQRARRRAGLLRYALMGGGALALLLLVVFVAGRLAGDGEGADAEGNRSPAAPVLLVVNEGGVAKGAVLVESSEARSLVLGMPAATLLEGPDGFEPLDSFLDETDSTRVLDPVESLFGLRPARVVFTEWARLREAAVAGSEGLELPPTLPVGGETGDAVAKAVAAFARVVDDDEGGRALEGMMTADEDRAALRVALHALPDDAAPTGLPGRLVEGEGYTYYEPDPVGVRAVTGTEAGTPLAVEVQNGSGMVGVTEAATAAIALLGYELLPARNADEFPDVAQTRILAPADSLGEAGRVRAALGVGRVIESLELPARRVVVVLGQDYKSPSTTSTSP